MPVNMKEENSGLILAAINKVENAIRTQKPFPNQVSVVELAGMNETPDPLLIGSSELELLYGENGVPYPPELQPLIGNIEKICSPMSS